MVGDNALEKEVLNINFFVFRRMYLGMERSLLKLWNDEYKDVKTIMGTPYS